MQRECEREWQRECERERSEKCVGGEREMGVEEVRGVL